jgi:cytidine deaminase
VSEIDWETLRTRAAEVMQRAYVPYLVDDGRVVAGCNVENAAYGVALCAECGLVSELVATGGGRLVAFTCCNSAGERLMPCGRCRQLLWEHGGPDLLVDTPEGVWRMADVLPQAFGPEDLDRGRG